MPVTYTPTHFWSVVFARTGSALPTVLPRSILLLPLAASAVLAVDEKLLVRDYSGGMNGLATIVGLLTAFRLNDAYSKWNRASEQLLLLHAKTRDVLAKLCAYTGQQPEAVPSIANVRRLLVLACVTIKMHIRGESDFSEHVECGLVTADEVAALTTSTCTKSVRDGKRDKFPSRNRPALVFHWAHAATSSMFRTGMLQTPNHHLAIESALTDTSAVFEEIEHLGVSVLPIAYAQLTRLVSLLFLVAFPFAYATEMVTIWSVLSISLIINVLFFTIDECASQMETPFGMGINDVELTKTIRRIDKHTAALLGASLGQVVDNYDIFPETRRTQDHHDDARRMRASLERVPTYARLNGTGPKGDGGITLNSVATKVRRASAVISTIGRGSNIEPIAEVVPGAKRCAVEGGGRGSGGDVEDVMVELPCRCSSDACAPRPPMAPLPDDIEVKEGSHEGSVGLQT